MAADWVSLGDASPERGALLVDRKSIRLDTRAGAITARCVTTTPETRIDGSPSIHLVQAGVLSLSGWDAASALATLGARMVGDHIVTPGHHGEEDLIPVSSPEGQLELLIAAHAFGGLTHATESHLVALDLPRPEDPVVDGFGEPEYWYPEGTSLWAAMRDVLEDFDHTPEDEPQAARRIVMAGPLQGVTRNLRDRADLMSVHGFSELPVDSDGNPCVWRNFYENSDEVDEDAGEMIHSWSDVWSCQCDDEDPETGLSLAPVHSEWIGPDHPVLQELWDRLPERGAWREPSPETPGGMRP